MYDTSPSRNRLTSSNFGTVCKMRPNTSCRTKVKNFLYGLPPNSSAIKYGIEMEQRARKDFEKNFLLEVESAGLFVDLEFGYLAASPDGKIGSEGLLEIKCPFILKDHDPRNPP